MTTTTPRPVSLAAPAEDDWRQKAACRDVEDKELFFPKEHTQGWRAQTRQAKQVCARCPVRSACLEWALDTRQTTGVWGGLSERERAGLIRVPESQTQRCWNNQAWIEKQIAQGAAQRDIARKLRVTRSVLCRAITQFEKERAADTAAEAVNAA